jgi:hypothetical protein
MDGLKLWKIALFASGARKQRGTNTTETSPGTLLNEPMGRKSMREEGEGQDHKFGQQKTRLKSRALIIMVRIIRNAGIDWG